MMYSLWKELETCSTCMYRTYTCTRTCTCTCTKWVDAFSDFKDTATCFLSRPSFMGLSSVTSVFSARRGSKNLSTSPAPFRSSATFPSDSPLFLSLAATSFCDRPSPRCCLFAASVTSSRQRNDIDVMLGTWRRPWTGKASAWCLFECVTTWSRVSVAIEPRSLAGNFLGKDSSESFHGRASSLISNSCSEHRSCCFSSFHSTGRASPRRWIMHDLWNWIWKALYSKMSLSCLWN